MHTLRIINRVLLILLLVCTLSLIFGDGGYFELKNLQRQYAQIALSNQRDAHRNELLAAEVLSLRERQQAVQERARHDLTMIRPGEVFFRINRPEKYVPGTKISADIINDPLYQPAPTEQDGQQLPDLNGRVIFGSQEAEITMQILKEKEQKQLREEAQKAQELQKKAQEAAQEASQKASQEAKLPTTP